MGCHVGVQLGLTTQGTDMKPVRRDRLGYQFLKVTYEVDVAPVGGVEAGAVDRCQSGRIVSSTTGVEREIGRADYRLSTEPIHRPGENPLLQFVPIRAGSDLVVQVVPRGLQDRPREEGFAARFPELGSRWVLCGWGRESPRQMGEVKGTG